MSAIQREMPGDTIESWEHRAERARSRTLDGDYSKQKEMENTSNFCQGFVSFWSFGSTRLDRTMKKKERREEHSDESLCHKDKSGRYKAGGLAGLG